MLKLETKPRNPGQKLDELRKSGLMPIVFYGKKQPSMSASVKLQDFIKVWEDVGETGVVTLSGAGNGEQGDLEALIHDIDFDPVKETPRHADFYVFEKGHTVKLAVPVEFVGVAPAVKDLGGILIKVLYEIKIEAMPKDLPRDLKIDVSKLVNFESQALAGDIAMPTGVTLLEAADEVVALVAKPKEEVVEEAAPVDLSAIEVEKKGKKEEESAEGEAAPAKGKEE
ncbi:MAG: 50S ribosomal protein L25 [Patescibacteria group bacterium]